VRTGNKSVALKIFNAEQTENPFLLDSSLVPTNPIDMHKPWEPSVAQRLVFISVQAKYRSLSWIEVPPPPEALPGAELKAGALPPHRVSCVSDTLLYHVTAFPIKQQCRVFRSLPPDLRRRRTIKATRFGGHWIDGLADCFQCRTRSYGDLGSLHLSDSDGFCLERLMASNIFVSADDVKGLGLWMPQDAKRYATQGTVAVDRFFVNREQVENPGLLFDGKQHMIAMTEAEKDVPVLRTLAEL
jgi:hypothetical protein